MTKDEEILVLLNKRIKKADSNLAELRSVSKALDQRLTSIVTLELESEQSEIEQHARDLARISDSFDEINHELDRFSDYLDIDDLEASEWEDVA